MNRKKRLIVIHPALAPYRIDFFNFLNEKFDAKFFFENKNLLNQRFDQLYLLKQCDFATNYLVKGTRFLGGNFRYDVFKVLIKNKPDVIFCSEYSFSTLLCLVYKKIVAIRKVKIIIITDDSLNVAAERRGFRRLITNYVIRNVNGIVYTSEEVASWYIEHHKIKSKTLVMPIIQSDSKFRDKLKESIPHAVKNFKRYNLKNHKVVLFVGRLVEVKNIDTLIKAFNNLSYTNTKLVIVGGGNLEDSLKELVTRLSMTNQVIFTGRQEKESLYAWYLLSQIFVLPSLYEPYGAVVNEALLAGCKVVCSKLAGASVLINNTNGLLFDPVNINELTEVLKRTLDEIEEDLSTDLKPSLMPFSLNSKIENFYNKLELLVK